ncbi:hypothetical protein [Nocardia fluminea]|uniref:Cell division protein FtsB n=1 Tax=Nocardia fluminea TaxID=134984 RepID=A0A2N3WZH7_9NOCA|nr:hypothetical protein [Nocardia fluminea]PKV99270.1 hypothetical protein ATK86_1316 [Nocardia fluminea]
MSVRTSTVAVPSKTARRVEAAERVKSGAAQRAYARKRTREQLLDGIELPERASTMAGRIPFVTAIIGLLGCGLALTLLLTTRAAEDSYQLGDARAVNRKLDDERAALQREVAAADSAPELAARARELGMIPAKDPARLLVGPDGEVTVIGNPTPAQGAPVPPLNGPPTTAATPAPGHAQAQGERVVPVQPGAATATPSAPATVLASPPAPPAPTVNTPQAVVPAAPAPIEVAVPAPANSEAPAPVDGGAPAPLAPATVPDRIDVAGQGAPLVAADTPPLAPDVAADPAIPAGAPLPGAVASPPGPRAPVAGPPSEQPQVVESQDDPR